MDCEDFPSHWCNASVICESVQAWEVHGEGKVMDLVDSILIFAEDERMEVQRVINIALLCSQDAAEQRLTMAKVVVILQLDLEPVLTSGKKSASLD